MTVNEEIMVHAVEEMFRSSENEINFIIQTMQKDKRSDKKWNEKVLESAASIRKTLNTFHQLLSAQQITDRHTHLDWHPSQISYASSLQQASGDREANVTKNVVIISPKTPEMVADSEQTLKLVQSTSGNKLRIGINNIKKMRNKSVLFELRNKEECSDFVRSVQEQNKNLVIKIPEKKNPRIIVFGIDSSFPNEELLEAIIEQNPTLKQCQADSNEHVTLRFMKHSRNGQSQFAVLEVTPKFYRAMMSLGKLYIGYMRCPVRDHIHVVRCHQCSAYGHFSSACSSEKRCSHCAGSHDRSDCEKTKTECINCKRYNNKMETRRNFKPVNTEHVATSPDCPAYKKIVDIIKSKINYG